KTKEISIIMKYWTRSYSVKMGWIDEFNPIITRYILRKYYRPLKILQRYPSYVRNVKFSPDGSKIVLCSDETVKIWNIESKKEIGILKGHSDIVNDAQFSPDGDMIVSCSDDKTIILWNEPSCKKTVELRGHKQAVTSVQFSPDGKTIVSGSHDQTVRIWNVYSGQEVIILGQFNNIIYAQFSPNDQQIISVPNNGSIEIWDVTRRKMICKLNENTQRKAKFSSNDHLVVSCSMDNTIRLWDVQLEVEIQKLQGYSDNIIMIAFLKMELFNYGSHCESFLFNLIMQSSPFDEKTTKYNLIFLLSLLTFFFNTKLIKKIIITSSCFTKTTNISIKSHISFICRSYIFNQSFNLTKKKKKYLKKKLLIKYLILLLHEKINYFYVKIYFFLLYFIIILSKSSIHHNFIFKVRIQYSIIHFISFFDCSLFVLHQNK
ncbi:hypothetical protein RFI_26536, partial [Reticulomyxa filosa]